MNYPSEVIIVMNKNQDRLYGKQSDMNRKEFLKWTKNVWFVQPEEDRSHPSAFPHEIPRRLIKLFSFVGQMVVDPFLGNGKTVKVAKEVNRNSIGIEISEKFLPLIKWKVGYEKDASYFEIIRE